MNKEDDIELLFKILDNALQSDNPSIKKALKNFLLVAALIDNNSDTNGPFSSLLEEVKRLRAKVEILEYDRINKNKYINTDIYPYTTTTGTTKTWVKSEYDNTISDDIFKDYIIGKIK